MCRWEPACAGTTHKPTETLAWHVEPIAADFVEARLLEQIVKWRRRGDNCEISSRR
jgi:hypothetical protein